MVRLRQPGYRLPPSLQSPTVLEPSCWPCQAVCTLAAGRHNLLPAACHVGSLCVPECRHSVHLPQSVGQGFHSSSTQTAATCLQEKSFVLSKPSEVSLLGSGRKSGTPGSSGEPLCRPQPLLGSLQHLHLLGYT